MDGSGLVEYINPAFTRATGYTTVELKGHAFSLLEVETEHPETYRQMWETIFSGNIFRGSISSRKKNGDALLVERTIAPLQDAQGKTTHFVCCDHDVTEKRRLEAQLLQAQKMDAIGRLAGGVAHDFNNLLMVISAYAELMQDSITHEHPLRRNVDQIMTASRRAADLTRQLLAFSRRQMQSLQVLDLNVLLRDAVRILPRLIGEDIQLQFLPGLEMAKVKCDPVQIEQIVMNLAANARDAMPHGGKFTIETSNVYLDETYLQRHSIVPAGDYVLMASPIPGRESCRSTCTIFLSLFTPQKKKAKEPGSAWLRCTALLSKMAVSFGCTASQAWARLSRFTGPAHSKN